MKTADFSTLNSSRVQVVDSLRALFEKPFSPSVNAFVYCRSLQDEFNKHSFSGQDFDALAVQMAQKALLTVPGAGLDQQYEALEDFLPLVQGQGERSALQCIFRDLDNILDLNRAGYAVGRLRVTLPQANQELEERVGPECFHGDGYPGDPYFENILCSYNGSTTEYIRNEDAISHQGARGLYYTPKEDGVIHRFGLGEIWRFAGTHPEGNTLPFIHRAPRMEVPKPRLLLSVLRSNQRLWNAVGL